MNTSLFKKHQRWIALLVAVAFGWLLHVTTMPLAAANETERPGAATFEQDSRSDSGQAPGFYEQLGPEWNRPAKVKITTVLIIAGALLAYCIIRVLAIGIGHEAATREAAGRKFGGMSGWNPGASSAIFRE